MVGEFYSYARFYHAFNKQAVRVKFDEEWVEEKPKQVKPSPTPSSPSTTSSKPVAGVGTPTEQPGNCAACGKVLEGQSGRDECICYDSYVCSQDQWRRVSYQLFPMCNMQSRTEVSA